ncbi:MAG: flavin reductase [Chloroflexi bacterium]|nr:flavin reductase [Chloroflexota bacterium]
MEQTLDPEKLRAAMRAWSAGVSVVTSVHESQQSGATVNSFTTISLEPSLLTVTLQKTSRTHDLISKSRIFGLTMLSAEQAHLADLFAGKTAAEDRFAGLQTETLVTGAPLIVGGLAWLDCRVVETFDAVSSTLFIAETLAAQTMNGRMPLVYHNREYWSLCKT